MMVLVGLAIVAAVLLVGFGGVVALVMIEDLSRPGEPPANNE